MFVGRKAELSKLKSSIEHSGTASMIYGIRKIGKTALIKEAVKSSRLRCVYYECVRGSLAENLSAFTNELSRCLMLPEGVTFRDWLSLFSYLNSLNEQLIIVVDEYPYLKTVENADYVDSLFQNIIDNRIKNIHLILSGSHIGMMKDLLEERNPLFSRFMTVIKLNPLSYLEAAEFYPDKSPYEKAAFYSVFGGSPFINSQLCATNTLRGNVVSTILNPVSAVRFYLENTLVSDSSARINFDSLLSAIGNGRKHYRELENMLEIEKNGNLSRQIKILINMEIINRNCPINRQNDPKKTFYEIRDNLLRFYYTFVCRNGSALQNLGEEVFYDEYIAPAVTEFISRRFEDICRCYFSELCKSGQLSGVKNIGVYYYDDQKKKMNGEFDIALEQDGGYSVWEAKYYRGKMNLDDIHREAGQIREIAGIAVKNAGFISINGFSDYESGYSYADGDNIYGPTPSVLK